MSQPDDSGAGIPKMPTTMLSGSVLVVKCIVTKVKNQPRMTQIARIKMKGFTSHEQKGSAPKSVF
jgi:hypothetical protein